MHRQRIRDMSIFAAMGDDGAAGTLRLGACARGDVLDGAIDIVWRGARELPLLDAQLRLIAERARAAGFAGRTLPNPFWRFLPESMAALIGDGRGAPVSVHPLGGCAMGATAADGVVDELGRVFDPHGDAGQPFHEGLLVLDGAIVPCALATNPALTIAARALRCVRTLGDRHWRWRRAPAAAPPALQRPRVAETEAAVTAPTTQAGDGTVVGVTERLGGAVKLADASGVVRDCWVELTLTYDPLRLTQLFAPDPGDGRLSRARLSIGGTPRSTGRLRIFLRDEWERLRLQPLAPADRERAEACVARSYALTGTLTLLQREASGHWRRTLRAVSAWLRNRGLRDLVQGGIERLGKWWRDEPRKALSWNDWLLGPFRLASRAGEVRRFDYALRIGAEQPPSDAAPRRFDAPPALVDGAIAGHKRITYARPSNPWRQLQELELTELAGCLQRRGPRVLSLDPQYLAERGHPLLRIEAQRDHVEALADFASLAACVLRMLLSIHLWSARKPDTPRHRLIERLPGIVPGLLEPQIHWIDVDRLGDAPVRIRLARYRTRATPVPGPARPAVLLIHGYSASGTTFAHPSLRPGLAQYLAGAGREVWIADLRSSAALPTATQPWSFERIALVDIPAAVDYVWRRSGEHRIDVLAHCMGATMLSMAVLSAGKTPAQIAELLARDGDEPVADPFRTERDALPRRIRRAVLSQNGPAMIMSQQNIFRAYVMSYFEHIFGPLPYAFRPEPGQGLAAGLLDRFLSSLPYPDEELRLENPWQPWRRTAYLATRHRMDALYGRTFSLKHLSRKVLDHIDDFFGPLSLRTVAQVIHFSQLGTITSCSGRNRFVTPAALQACWTFPTLSLHGADNGLADLATAYRVQALLHGAGRHCEVVPLHGQGHQDCLIGVRARETFDEVLSFFERADDDPRFTPPAPAEACVAQAPWLGPLLARDAAGTVHAGLGACPRLGRPIALRVLPVERVGGAWRHERLVQVLGLVEADLRLALPADTDWFSVALPAWSRSVRQLALLLVYGQPLSSDSASAPTVQGAVERALRASTGDAAAGIVELGWTHADQPLRLALGSCQYPAGLFNEEPAHEAWRRLNARFDRDEGPHYLVLTGDQIYADATAGLFDPTQRDDRYRKPYEAWLRNAQVRAALRRAGVLTMLDDHEIDDNWEPLPGRPGDAAFDANERLRRDGVAYFRRFQRPADRGGPLWLQHEAAGVHLFVLDTRTQRAPRCASAPAAAMIDEAQWHALEAWLCDGSRRDAPKLIVSPAALLPRHRDAVRAHLAHGAQDSGDHACLHSDGCDGDPDTLYRLLALIADRAIPHVVFVSGDEHLGLHVRARVRGPRTPRGDKGVVVHSIHAPGLNTPYAFANARGADFIL
ncbi:MAG: alpha/beta fold hydrolase, partial [Gammaproteobacteria bacterium]